MCNLLRYDEDIEGVTGTFRVAPSEPAPVLTLDTDGAAQVGIPSPA